MPEELKAISDKVDGLIFCDLISYNEVDAGQEAAEFAASACLGALTGFPFVGYSESTSLFQKNF